MGKQWTPVLVKKLRELYPDQHTDAIAKELGFTYSAVRSKARVLKLKKAPGFNRSKFALSPEERLFIRDNYTKHTNHELAKITGRSEASIQKIRKEFNLSKPNAGVFKKGIIPWSKGKKMPPGWGGETRFKKGQQPHNTKHDGFISVRDSKGRPYQWIRIGKGKWELLQRNVWRQHFGEIPEGYNVEFKDRNPLNCVPENLILVSRPQNMLQNSIMRFPPELISTIKLVSKFKRKVNEYAEKQNRRS